MTPTLPDPSPGRKIVVSQALLHQTDLREARLDGALLGDLRLDEPSEGRVIVSSPADAKGDAQP